MTPKLKQCPFCNNKMDDYDDCVYPIYRDKSLWNVTCNACEELVYESTEEKAVKKWNEINENV